MPNTIKYTIESSKKAIESIGGSVAFLMVFGSLNSGAVEIACRYQKWFATNNGLTQSL